MVSVFERKSVQLRDEAQRVSGTVHMLSVLLYAGIGTASAWAYLAESGNADALRVTAELGDGRADMVDAIAAAGKLWGAVAAVWFVAQEVGAPLAQTLREFAATVQDIAALSDEIQVALAEPMATAKLLLWLPLVGLLLGFLLGFDPLGLAFRHPLIAGAMLGGLVLIGIARFWTHRIVKTANPVTPTAGMPAELVAVALSGGSSAARAQHLMQQALHHFLTPGAGSRGQKALPATNPGAQQLRMPVALEDEVNQVGVVLALSQATGAPARDLLRAQSAQVRQVAKTEGRMRAARLGTRLLMPLTVCTLPSFVLLGLVPLIGSVLFETTLLVS